MKMILKDFVVNISCRRGSSDCSWLILSAGLYCSHQNWVTKNSDFDGRGMNIGISATIWLDGRWIDGLCKKWWIYLQFIGRTRLNIMRWTSTPLFPGVEWRVMESLFASLASRCHLDLPCVVKKNSDGLFDLQIWIKMKGSPQKKSCKFSIFFPTNDPNLAISSSHFPGHGWIPGPSVSSARQIPTTCARRPSTQVPQIEQIRGKIWKNGGSVKNDSFSGWTWWNPPEFGCFCLWFLFIVIIIAITIIISISIYIYIHIE